MSSFNRDNGIHFTDPKQFYPYAGTAANIEAVDSANTRRTSATTEFFTELARRGVQEQTNWTADTYKTLLNVSSGEGFVAGVIGCTAGGSETTTFEITVDGLLTEVAVPVTSGQRALLTAGYIQVNPFDNSSSTPRHMHPSTEALDSGKNYFSETQADAFIAPWFWYAMFGTPLLKFSQSLLIRAKHSANITNSTATAYSAVMYRELL